MTTAVGERFGTGLLSKAAAFVYHLLVVELLLLATAGPGLAVTVLLDRHPSNLPLAALCLLPVGPAVSAAVYALHHRKLDLTDLRPAALFLRGLRLDAGQAARLWAVWLAVLAVQVGGGGPVLLVGGVATLWVLNALVITSLFEFRTRDVARLAAYLMVAKPSVTVANLCLLVVAVGGVWFWSEAALALAGSLLVLGLLSNSRAMIAVVRDEFTR
ncbi:hypothetical protein [Actinoplanes utahensis]|uniref:DUF624 domain-containing protein n=1 Tax=Actinoplanes utahensis TaxID=1869 RepID=A0A0A6X426_ACTUT|nr:hypothetical protein [Actinoplanes utahensis]KHD74842.1 hypothetical protein MB27_26245 [Actinoplanes utahensis]GIF30791.1 hypothetical protein Aut01nite_37770 [Actinoplanes utahensis]